MPSSNSLRSIRLDRRRIVTEPSGHARYIGRVGASHGQIAHRLIQARALADSDLVLLHIDTALMLVRRAHHTRTLGAYYADGTAATA